MYKINKNNYNKKLNIDNNKIYNILKLLENELNEIEKKEYRNNYKNRIKNLYNMINIIKKNMNERKRN